MLVAVYFLCWLAVNVRVGAGVKDGLYDVDEDNVLPLNNRTFEDRVANREDNVLWVVEFYNSWCGHCVHFAPIWKQVAADFKDWRDLVIIAAIDCSQALNLEVCRKYDINAYPTVKVFPPSSIKDGKIEILNLLSQDLEVVKKSILAYMVANASNSWPHLQPLEKVDDIWQYKTFSHEYVLLLFEEADSPVGVQVILDVRDIPSVLVCRMLKESVTKYGINRFPSLYRVSIDSTFSALAVGTKMWSNDRKAFVRTIRMLVDDKVGGVSMSRIVNQNVQANQGKQQSQIVLQPAKKFDRVSMQDLESALHYSLRQEVAIKKVIDGDTLLALQTFLDVLVKYFPGRKPVLGFLIRVRDMLNSLSSQNITGEDWLSKIDSLQDEDNFLPAVVEWEFCLGSSPRYRGYPCSIWVLFHILTVSAYNQNTGTRQGNPQEVLLAIRGYMQHYFGCHECSKNFLSMAQTVTEEVHSHKDSVIWLWSAHNKANKRLRGDISEDPKHPKIEFPSDKMCPPCRLRSSADGDLKVSLDVGKVVDFLVNFYSGKNIAPATNLHSLNPALENSPVENKETDWWESKLLEQDQKQILLLRKRKQDGRIETLGTIINKVYEIGNKERKETVTSPTDAEQDTGLSVINDAGENDEESEDLQFEISRVKELNPFWAPSLDELYKIVECISSGSPSSVFLVKNKKERQYYALKKIECHDESDAKQVFYEELELKNLEHPYICNYKEFFITYEKECSTVYVNIISQYFPDGNLRTFIKKYQDSQREIPEQLVKKILGEILDALVYLHDNECLHRNIKPTNIFQRKGGAMVLGDMGVASIMGDLRTNTRQTFQGTVFMAPEIGQQHHNMKTDLYSVGGVLLNLLTTCLYQEQQFYHKLGQIKESPEELNVVVDLVSNKYSKPMINTVQMLLRHKESSRPSTLEFIKSGFVQECMALADVSQFEASSWTKKEGPTKLYQLTENRDQVATVLNYIEHTMDNEECLADGLSALADILRDNDQAHELIDQKDRSLITLAMWNNIFNKDIQIAGCYILSNLIVTAKPNDVLFGQDVVTIIHKIMNGHEYNPEVQLAAADLILALSTNEKASLAIVQLGGIQNMVRAMRHARYHATLNAVCCMALWSLTIDSENLKVAAKENAARDVCVALCTHKVSPEVCEAAAAALLSLLLDDSCYAVFDELDCVGNLVAAIYMHTQNAKVVKNCCKVLATVIESDEDSGYRFIADDKEDDDLPRGIPTVMKAYNVHKDNADVVESVVRLLLELSQYEGIAAELMGANVGPLLLSEVHKRYKQNKAIMGPVETALNRMDMLVTSPSRPGPRASVHSVHPARPFKFDGEVKGSCKTMTRRW